MPNKKHILICKRCLKTSDDKSLTFYICDTESRYSVYCIDCIINNNILYQRNQKIKKLKKHIKNGKEKTHINMSKLFKNN